MMRVCTRYKLIISIFLGVLYFFCIPEKILQQDLAIYYTKFDLSYIDFDIAKYHNHYMDTGHHKFSLESINILPITLYSITSIFPFAFFVIVNISFILFVYIYPVRFKSIFEAIIWPLNIAMFLMVAYVWRQALAVGLALLVIKSVKIKIKPLWLGLIALVAHPSVLLFFLIEIFRRIFVKRPILYGSISGIFFSFIVHNFSSSSGGDEYPGFVTLFLVFYSLLIFTYEYTKNTSNSLLSSCSIAGSASILTLLIMNDNVQIISRLSAMFIVVIFSLRQSQKINLYSSMHALLLIALLTWVNIN